jgi:hypothetical protein
MSQTRRKFDKDLGKHARIISEEQFWLGYKKPACLEVAWLSVIKRAR